jgi:hypothetical protein
VGIHSSEEISCPVIKPRIILQFIFSKTPNLFFESLLFVAKSVDFPFLNALCMRKVILSVDVSVDGFIEGPNGKYDWCVIEKDYSIMEFFSRIESIFDGPKTY